MQSASYSKHTFPEQLWVCFETWPRNPETPQLPLHRAWQPCLCLPVPVGHSLAEPLRREVQKARSHYRTPANPPPASISSPRPLTSSLSRRKFPLKALKTWVQGRGMTLDKKHPAGASGRVESSGLVSTVFLGVSLRGGSSWDHLSRFLCNEVSCQLLWGKDTEPLYFQAGVAAY